VEKNSRPLELRMGRPRGFRRSSPVRTCRCLRRLELARDCWQSPRPGRRAP
jgi:hypothetical protein